MIETKNEGGMGKNKTTNDGNAQEKSVKGKTFETNVSEQTQNKTN